MIDEVFRQVLSLQIMTPISAKYGFIVLSGVIGRDDNDDDDDDDDVCKKAIYQYTEVI